MWIGVYEFMHCTDVPWRVAINECIELAKEFGGTDGHKYVNAVLGAWLPSCAPAKSRQSCRSRQGRSCSPPWLKRRARASRRRSRPGTPGDA